MCVCRPYREVANFHVIHPPWLSRYNCFSNPPHATITYYTYWQCFLSWSVCRSSFLHSPLTYFSYLYPLVDHPLFSILFFAHFPFSLSSSRIYMYVQLAVTLQWSRTLSFRFFLALCAPRFLRIFSVHSAIHFMSTLHCRLVGNSRGSRLLSKFENFR